MNLKKKLRYEPPQLAVMTCRVERGFAGSGSSPLSGVFRLGVFRNNNGSNPWGGSGPSGNSVGGGWTDNGDNPWN